MQKMSRITISVILALLLFAQTMTIAFAAKENEAPQNRLSFTGELKNTLKILSVTVTPHTRSGSVRYDLGDENSTNRNLGALIQIYIKNISGRPLSPEVLFAGKTACAYLDMSPQKMSWASTPDTRRNRKYDRELTEELAGFIPLSTEIPADAVDCYTVNVTDGRLLSDGLPVTFVVDGVSDVMTVLPSVPGMNVCRLQWESSSGKKAEPDRLEYCIRNTGGESFRLNDIQFYDGTDEYYLHYWRELTDGFDAAYPVEVNAGSLLFGEIGFPKSLPFREYLVEFNFKGESGSYSLICKTRPMIHDFDISVGWAGSDLEKESYIKAISSMHFNTVIGAAGSGYYLRDEAFRAQYPIKIFGYQEGLEVGDGMTVENGAVTVYDIEDMHAALPFGEPQLKDSQENYQPMRVYNKLATYRNAPYATNVTLTHEPSFYRFSGLSDFCHYDAYRVTAPFSDAWYLYLDAARQNKYAIYWGAPLETAGDYMRTLSSLQRPNPVAAWTQGANIWNTFPRFTSDKRYMCAPNPYELRIQAYENIANGAASLYWFNINGEDLLYCKESAAEMRDINRECAAASPYLAKQIPFWHARQKGFDLNVNVGKDWGLLFACDLRYGIIDDQYHYFGGCEKMPLTFEIPDTLIGKDLVKISKDGVTSLSADFSNGTITFDDRIDMTAMYLLADGEEISALKQRYTEVLRCESFNIYEDDAAYDELQRDYGYTYDNPFKPDKEKENRIIVVSLYPLVRLLERLIQVIAAVASIPIDVVKAFM